MPSDIDKELKELEKEHNELQLQAEAKEKLEVKKRQVQRLRKQIIHEKQKNNFTFKLASGIKKVVYSLLDMLAGFADNQNPIPPQPEAKTKKKAKNKTSDTTPEFSIF